MRRRWVAPVAFVLIGAACAGRGELADTVATPTGGSPAPPTIGAEAAPTSAAGAMSGPETTASPPASSGPATPESQPVYSGNASIAGCPLFPEDNWWRQDVSGLPVHPRSNAWVASIGANGNLHPDWGGPYGIPYVQVPAQQPRVNITYTDYGDESDPGPFPIPLDAPIEGGPDGDGDRHVIAVQEGTCELFELFYAFRNGDGWSASSGARFDLRSNALRPERWTSADAAGLPILPGLVRYEEVQAGAIHHALRFTVSDTQRAYFHPATHWASSSSDPNLPPMGARFRLRADYDISGFPHTARVILQALKTYGMFLADNGSDWFLTGATDSRWNYDDLDPLKSVPGSAFEAVDTSEQLHTP